MQTQHILSQTNRRETDSRARPGRGKRGRPRIAMTTADYTIRLDARLKSRLQQLAHSQGRKLSQLIREALEHYLRYVQPTNAQHLSIRFKSSSDQELYRLLEYFKPWLQLAIHHYQENTLHLILSSDAPEFSAKIHLYDFEGFRRYLKSKPHVQLYP